MIEPVFSNILAVRPELGHGFFTRQGGVSTKPYASLNCSWTSGDRVKDVAENRRRVAEAMGVGLESLVTCRQVHSRRALLVEGPWASGEEPEADAMVTTQRGLVLGILTADCVPVLLADPQAGVIAAAHAGWRGALDGVLDHTVALMEQNGATRDSILAAVGPAIWQESYEVTTAFAAPFAQETAENKRFFKTGTRAGHLLFDLPGYVAARLSRLGLARISPSLADTCRDETGFFSYRRGVLRGEPEAGRMLSCIVLKQSREG